jgi:hypothetical protein
MHLRVSSLSTEYIRVPVAALDDEGALVDVTGMDVELAFVDTGVEPDDESGSEDWWEADWETSELAWVDVGATRVQTPYKARVLIGPAGDVDLGDGTFDVWVRITDQVEVPVRLAGGLTIT